MCILRALSILSLHVNFLRALASHSPPLSSQVGFSDLLKRGRDSDFESSLQAIRQDFHRYPEISLEEFNTSYRIRRELQNLGIEPFSYESVPTAVFGLIGRPSPSDGPTFALRADIDALPIQEALDVPFKSLNEGKMHACGHDAHIAMLLGAARLLKRLEPALPGRVLLVFQPAEEGKGGAKRVLETGVLEEHQVQGMAGLHVWPELPSGVLGIRPGVIMAASDRFRVVVQGRGGHAALPHLAIDPVLAASQIVGAAQGLVSRETSPLSSAVLSITRVNTGPGAPNVIPDTVELQGTIRALTQAHHSQLRQRFEAVVAHVAALSRCNYTIEWSPVPYPPTVNDKNLAGAAARLGTPIFDAVEVLEEPSMAAEDFSFYARRVPSVFSFIGVGGRLASGGSREDFRPPEAGLHHPKFRMDDSVLGQGATFLASMAVDFFGSAHAKASDSMAESDGSPSRKLAVDNVDIDAKEL